METEAEFDLKLRQKREASGCDPTSGDAPRPKSLADTFGPTWLAANAFPLNEQRAAKTDAQLLDNAIAKAKRTLVTEAGSAMRDCRLGSYRAAIQAQRDALTVLCDYVRDLPARVAQGEGIVLFGPCGTGKDHLAFGVSWAAAERHAMKIRWTNGQDWFGTIRDAMDDGTSERSVIGRLANPQIAVISDLLPPIGALTQHQATMLYRLIDDRRNAGRPTIVTVNVADDAEAIARMGVPTWDRLCDNANKIFCNWSSYRHPVRKVGC